MNGVGLPNVLDMLKITHEEENALFLLDERDALEAQHSDEILLALEAQLAQLELDPESELETAALSAAILALLLAANELGVQSFNNQPVTNADIEAALEDAVAKSEEQAGIATEQINSTTADAIVDAVTAGLVGTALIEAILPMFEKTRAELIAKNEGTIGFNDGVQSAGDDVGVTIWEWITMLDDSVCIICKPLEGIRRNEGEAFVDSNGSEVFQPAHIGCRCTESPVQNE